MSWWKTIGCTRSVFETCSDPLCFMYKGDWCGGGTCDSLPEENELGTREDLLHALGTCARLCYGTGLFDLEGSDWGQLDPPLDGEGWMVIDQICETMHSEDAVQAGLYILETRKVPIAIVAFRGTCSLKGVRQDVSVGSPLFRRKAKRAVREACYLAKCRNKLGPSHHIYVTGHSLGGFIAEACASYMAGAAFNSPGPLALSPWRWLVGAHRPNFEVHLTRDDPLAMSLFPKPESQRHIAEVEWHPGHEHKICEPYVRPISAMSVRPNRLPKPTDQQMVNQVEDLESLYPPPEEISDVESEETSDDEAGCCG